MRAKEEELDINVSWSWSIDEMTRVNNNMLGI